MGREALHANISTSRVIIYPRGPSITASRGGFFSFEGSFPFHVAAFLRSFLYPHGNACCCALFWWCGRARSRAFFYALLSNWTKMFTLPGFVAKGLSPCFGCLEIIFLEKIPLGQSTKQLSLRFFSIFSHAPAMDWDWDAARRYFEARTFRSDYYQRVYTWAVKENAISVLAFAVMSAHIQQR